MNKNKLWNIALVLAIITVFYNVVEGGVSVYFGAADETLSLFGFGLDSFIEVLSGIGIWHMIVRIRHTKEENRDFFEKRALKITGVAFYLLAVGLIVTVMINSIAGHKPVTTFWGIMVAIVSIISMVILTKAKLYIGRNLNSSAIIADANCTKTCLYLSVILLFSSVFYMIFNMGYIDSLGALGMVYYAYKEGRESFEKAKGNACSCATCHQAN